MWVRPAIFSVALFGTLAFAIWRGRSPERITATLLVLAALASALLPDNNGTQFVQLYRGDFLVDTLLLAALCPVALYANRYWPLWVTSLQLLTIGIHLVRIYDPMILPSVYAWAASKTAYPMQGLLAVGTWRLHSRNLINGREADWA